MTDRGQRNRELDAMAERLQRAVKRVEAAERRLLQTAGIEVRCS